MKRVPEILSYCCVITVLMTSGMPEKRSGFSPCQDFTLQNGHDTTGLTGLLKVDTFHLAIIPPSSGVRFFRNGIVFLSNTKFEGKMLPKHVSFGSDEAYTAILKDTSLGLHMLFSPASVFSYPCEALTFSSDFKTMYFTMIAKKEKKEKIYRSEYKTDAKGQAGWVSDPGPLGFCSGNYIYTHPALSADGKMMIFASDMAGTSGGLDLFVVRNTDGKWSMPENLGKSINTGMYECYPFLDEDNNLYYSSDGLPGYGGYDIYTCRYNGVSWGKPVNLSQRINSADDDISFSIDKTDGKTAFYTKRQKSAKVSMHLFKVTLKKYESDDKPLTISYIFNGGAASKAEALAMKPDDTAGSEIKEPVKTGVHETKKAELNEEKKAVPEPEHKINASGGKVVNIKSTIPIPDEFKDIVVYRVQFLSTSKPRKESQVLINGVPYYTYEYFYLGLYRYTIGEFKTLSPARELQNICKKSGYPQAFVAAFKNNTRSLDLSSFK